MIASKYDIVQKLGWGHGGIIYLCKDITLNTYKALKIFKSHKFYRQEFKDEVKILEKIHATSDGRYTVKLLDHFKIKGKENESHVCAVYELLGVSLYEILKFYKFSGFPLPLCRFIIKEVLEALVIYHNTCGIFIGDIRAKNILLKLTSAQLNSIEEKGIMTEKLDFAVFKHTNTPHHILNQVLGCNFSIDTQKNPKKGKQKNRKAGNSRDILKQMSKLGLINEEFLIKFINLGSANELSENCIREIPTLNYRCPEILLKMIYTSAIDMWSVGCLLFELVTGYFLFEPIKNKGYKKEDDLFAQMIEHLGDLPLDFIKKSTVFNRHFNVEGKLKHIKMLRKWPLKYLLIERHGIIPEEAEPLAEFLKCFLTYDPSQRITAVQALQHPWLNMKSRDKTMIPKEKMKDINIAVENREKKFWEACLTNHEYAFEPILK